MDTHMDMRTHMHYVLVLWLLVLADESVGLCVAVARAPILFEGVSCGLVLVGRDCIGRI